MEITLDQMPGSAVGFKPYEPPYLSILASDDLGGRPGRRAKLGENWSGTVGWAAPGPDAASSSTPRPAAKHLRSLPEGPDKSLGPPEGYAVQEIFVREHFFLARAAN